MKKAHRVLRDILFRNYENDERFLSQKSIAESCEISLGTVNPVVSKLEDFGAVERRPQGFRIRDARKILQYWSANRDLRKDVVFAAFSPDSPEEIEEQFPPEAIFTAYSGYRINFDSISSEYPEVYVYADPDEVARRFQQREGEGNIFVLDSDEHLRKISEGDVAPLVQIYVDLWQLPPPADRFLEELGRELRSARAGVEAVFGTRG